MDIDKIRDSVPATSHRFMGGLLPFFSAQIPSKLTDPSMLSCTVQYTDPRNTIFFHEFQACKPEVQAIA